MQGVVTVFGTAAHASTRAEAGPRALCGHVQLRSCPCHPSRRPLDRTFQPGPLSVQDQDSASDPEGAWGCAGSWEPCALVPVITLKPRTAGVVLKSCRFTCLVAMEAPTWAKTSMTEK